MKAKKTHIQFCISTTFTQIRSQTNRFVRFDYGLVICRPFPERSVERIRVSSWVLVLPYSLSLSFLLSKESGKRKLIFSEVFDWSKSNLFPAVRFRRKLQWARQRISGLLQRSPRRRRPRRKQKSLTFRPKIRPPGLKSSVRKQFPCLIWRRVRRRIS